MPAPTKKLTKKQQEEEEKKKKEEELKIKQLAIEEKKKKELELKLIEEARLKKLEDERLAKEELERLMIEEEKLEFWKRNNEEIFNNCLKKKIEDEDWKKYSYCDEGYINVRKEKDLNGFIYDFKERCDFNFISKFQLVEKNFLEEISVFDNSQVHYNNLMRLLLEGKATHNIKLIRYSLDYLNAIREIECQKMESMTRYFMENFEFMKKITLDDFLKRNKNSTLEDVDFSSEWSNKLGTHKFAMWINNPEKKLRETQTKFKNLPLQIISLPKPFHQNPSIIRFYWNKNDVRELQKKEYSPFISISGIFFIDQLIYPNKPQTARSWEIREMIGNKYKAKENENKETNSQNLKFQYRIELAQNIFIKDLDNLCIGRYEDQTGKWNLNNIDMPEFIKEKKNVSFYCNELDNFSILLERKIFFPYKSWYLRCIDERKAILDLETPRIPLRFEVTDKYVKIIDNTEPELAHILNKEFNYDQILIELRNCGILLTPLDEDIISVGLKVKNNEAQDRAINDIVMACRNYAIKSHEMNPKLSDGIVIAKFKPNQEYDFFFFDDEEDDWMNVAWFFNKCTIGNIKTNEEGLVFESNIETSRPNFHSLIKDKGEEDIYDIISETKQGAEFLLNLRSLLRILGIINMP